MSAEDELESLLAADGAELIRQGNHNVYKLSNGQLFTFPSTPSDHRAYRNGVSILRKLLGIQREIRKNPNRKAKPGVCGTQKTAFEKVDPKPGWKQQLSQATFWMPEEER